MNMTWVLRPAKNRPALKAPRLHQQSEQRLLAKMTRRVGELSFADKEKNKNSSISNLYRMHTQHRYR